MLEVTENKFRPIVSLTDYTLFLSHTALCTWLEGGVTVWFKTYIKHSTEQLTLPWKIRKLTLAQLLSNVLDFLASF